MLDRGLDEIVALDPAVVCPATARSRASRGRARCRSTSATCAPRRSAASTPGSRRSRRRGASNLGPYARWSEPERILFNVERAYRELRGEPYDAPIDVTALFRAMYELREARRAGA